MQTAGMTLETSGASGFVGELDRALGLSEAGGGGEGAGDAPDLLRAVLSEDEIAAIVGDESAPDEMFAEAAAALASSAARRPAGGGLPQPTADRLRLAYDDARSRRRGAAVPLFAHLFTLLRHTYTYLQSVLLDFAGAADVPCGVWEEAVGREVAAWADEERVAWALRAVVRRAKHLRLNAPDEYARDGGRLLALAERILLGPEAARSAERAGVKGYSVKSELASTLVQLKPAVSLPLLDRALEENEARLWPDAAPVAALPESYSEARADRMLALNSHFLDRELAKNPLLGAPQVWTLYARYVRRGERAAGEVLAGRPEVLDHFLRNRMGLALRGAISVLDPAQVTTPMVEAAYASLAADPPNQSGDARLARLVFARMGEGAAAALLRLKNDDVARALASEWRAGRRDGILLDALLKYPRQEVRTLLLFCEPEPKSYNSEVVSAAKLSEEARAVYRDKVLPHFARDRAEFVRNTSMRLLMELTGAEEGGEDRDGQAIALRHASVLDLEGFAGKAESLGEDYFDILLSRATGEHAGTGLLKKLAARADLTLEQYRRIAAAGSDDVTAHMVAYLPAEVGGEPVKEFLLSLRDDYQGAAAAATLVALSQRDEWDEYERPFYGRHRNSAVRRNFAQANKNLNVYEVVELLRDGDGAVRHALLNNPLWIQKYAPLVAEKVGV